MKRRKLHFVTHFNTHKKVRQREWKKSIVNWEGRRRMCVSPKHTKFDGSHMISCQYIISLTRRDEHKFYCQKLKWMENWLQNIRIEK